MRGSEPSRLGRQPETPLMVTLPSMLIIRSISPPLTLSWKKALSSSSPVMVSRPIVGNRRPASSLAREYFTGSSKVIEAVCNS